MADYEAQRSVDNYLVSLYLGTGAIDDEILAAKINKQSKRLPLMFWGQDRRFLSRQLSRDIQSRININPLNREPWLQLSYLQKDAGTSITERMWVIDRAANLVAWNFDRRTELSHHCIVDYHEFWRINPTLCTSVLDNLPKIWAMHTKAKKANVTLARLKNVLAQHEQLKRERKANTGQNTRNLEGDQF